MRFRRKSTDAVVEPDDLVDAAGGPEGSAGPPAPEGTRAAGPFDIDEVGDDGVERVDLGSLLIAPEPERELRLQVDESSQTVQSVMIAGQDGGVELRAFAAPRHGDLWTEARTQIAADTAQHGGTATEREGRFGVELVLQRPGQTPEGKAGMQTSRVVGINGPRWFLRATFLGRPAVEPEEVPEWDDTLARVVVSRGSQAMPPGDPLPLTLPPTARRAP